MLHLRTSLSRAIPSATSLSFTPACSRSISSIVSKASPSTSPCYSRLNRQQRSVNLIAVFRRSYATDKDQSTIESSEETSTKLPTDATPNAKDAAKEAESSAESFVEEAKDAVKSSYDSAKESVGEAMGAVADRINPPRASAAQPSPVRREDRAVDRFDRVEPSAEEAGGNLFCGNLFFEVTEDDLKQEFSRFGNVLEVKIIRDGRQLSKGFGYVKFENPSHAAEAKQSLDGQQFEGRRLVVQHSISKARPSRPAENEGTRNPPSRTLFVGNMSYDMSDNDLNELFKTIKNVLDVRVAIDRRTGQPRGFAHADFTDVPSAEAAAQLLNGKEFHGRRLRIDFSASTRS